MIAAARRFVRFGECAAHHDRVCATGQRFANVTTSTHPSIGAYLHVTECFFYVTATHHRETDRGGNLRYPISINPTQGITTPLSDTIHNHGSATFPEHK